jgi:hypothetical protein
VKVPGRLIVALVTATAVVGGGLVLEREVEAGAPAAPRVDERSGSLYCPHGGGDGWRAWVTVANPGTDPAQVRVTSSTGSTAQQVRELLAPGTHRTLEVPAGQTAAASVVEFFGVRVAAGWVVARPEDQGGGVAAEGCAPRAAARWWVPEASTLRGETSHVVVHNPFAVQSVVDVSIVAGRRTLRPGNLKGLVLQPGQVRAVDLGRFALGEQALAAAVTAPLGRVVVAGLGGSSGGIRAVQGVIAPSRRWILPAAGDGSGSLTVSATADPAPIHARAQTAQGEAPLIDLETVAADSVVAFEEGAREAGVVVGADGPAPFLAGRRLVAAAPAPEPTEEPVDRPGGRRDRDDGRTADREPETAPPSPLDLAGTAGSSRPAAGWVVLPPTAPAGGPAIVLLQNPDETPAEVQVTALGPDGPSEPQTVTVAPRSTARVDLPQPAAAAIRAVRGAVVAAGAALGPRTYAVATGVVLD